MVIHVHIDAVDGETVLRNRTSSPEQALGFLGRYDHEGSAVTVRLELSHEDNVYAVLNRLTQPTECPA